MNFKYIIVTPSVQKFHDTLFNRFNKSIIESINFLDFIARLPIDLEELKLGWPLSAARYKNDSKYNIMYLNESILTADLLYSFSPYIYGAFFIVDEVSFETIKLIRKHTRLPIVSNKKTSNTMVYDKSLFTNLYSCWSKNTKEIFIEQNKENQFQDYFQLKNFTKINCYKAPSTHFIRPLHRTINRLRGLYQDVADGLFMPAEPINPEIFEEREAEADEEILKALKQLIVDRFIALNVGFIAEDSFDGSDEQILNVFGIRKEEIVALYEQKDEHSYQRIEEKLINNFDALNFKTDMVLCFPSVNYKLLMKFNDLAKKNKLPKKVLGLMYNSSFYYLLFDPSILDGTSEKRKDFNFASFHYAASERASELALLSSLYTVYSLGKRIPFIRTRNVPSQEFYTKTYALSQYSIKMEERNKVSDFVSTFKQLSSFLANVVPDKQWEVILNNGNHIKVLSDMPVEWTNVRGLPLCIEKKFSRVPITPGNGLISHSYTLGKEYTVTKDNLRILILNTLNKDEQLYPLGVNLPKEIDKYLKLIERKAVYREVSNKDDFISIIEEIKPTVLIFYGHGSYDTTIDTGKLHIGNDYITAVEIENIKHTPLITILGACETQVLHGIHLNTASLFLGNLSVSVLGTFFPVDGLQTFSFISSLIRNLVNTLIGVAPKSSFEYWNDIILQTYRAHYILEPVRAIESYLVKRGKSLKAFIEDPQRELFQCAQKKGIFDFVEILRNREDLYQEIFSKTKELENAFKSILENNLLLQESLFYSSLGSPEMIKVIREQTNNMRIEDLHEYLRTYKY